MKYILVILAALIMVNCERDKESLPGSYKLEKPKTTDDKIAYGSSPFANSLGKTDVTYQISSYSYEKGTSLGIVKELAVSLKVIKKNEKVRFELSINDKNDDSASTLTKSIPATTDAPTEFDFTLEDIRYHGAIICKEADCKTIRFAFAADKKSINVEIAKAFLVSFLSATAETDLFTFKSMCYSKNSLTYEKMKAEPFYILNLPDGSEELSCWQP